MEPGQVISRRFFEKLDPKRNRTVIVISGKLDPKEANYITLTQYLESRKADEMVRMADEYYETQDVIKYATRNLGKNVREDDDFIPEIEESL